MLPDDVRAALDAAKKDGGKALMDTVAEAWKKQAEAKGEAKGLAAGEAPGREKGLTTGETLGREKGLVEGETRSLLRLLVKRFGTLPEPVLAQIAAGSTEELNRWFDTAITAPDLEAVFGERRDH